MAVSTKQVVACRYLPPTPCHPLPLLLLPVLRTQGQPGGLEGESKDAQCLSFTLSSSSSSSPPPLSAAACAAYTRPTRSARGRKQRRAVPELHPFFFFFLLLLLPVLRTQGQKLNHKFSSSTSCPSERHGHLTVGAFPPTHCWAKHADMR